MSKREILLNALAATPGDLERLVKSVDSAILIQRPTPQDWSIADVLCHLAMVEKLSLARLQSLVVEERPEATALLQRRLPSIHPIHPDPSAHDLTQPVATMLVNFRQARQTTLVYLQGLKAGDWQRAGLHPTRGRMTLRALVQYLVDHDTAHLNQIIEMRDQRLEIRPISNLQSPISNL